MDIITNAMSGGLFGILGTTLNRVAGYFERKQQNAHELKKWEHEERRFEHEKELRDMDFTHEQQLHKLNMEAARQRTMDDIAVTDSVGSWEGMKASIEHDASIQKVAPWVNNLRALVRPLLTVLLWLIVAWIFKKTADESIVEAATFAATAATLWWFGDRYKKPLSGVRLPKGFSQ